jgi:serine/threonine protein kinase
LDRRADVYALGCVAYWLLTGELVFEADMPLRMLARHLQDRPVPPTQRGAESMPSDLERLIPALPGKAGRRAAIERGRDRRRARPDGGQSLLGLGAARTWWRVSAAAAGGAPAATERCRLVQV